LVCKVIGKNIRGAHIQRPSRLKNPLITAILREEEQYDKKCPTQSLRAEVSLGHIFERSDAYMKSPKKIEAFIREWLDLFGFAYDEVIGVEDLDSDDDFSVEIVDAPMVVNNQLVTENLAKAAEAFGVKQDDLVNMDDTALRTQLQKYKYFDLLKAFEMAYTATFYAPGYEQTRLIKAIFGENLDAMKHYPSRYDYKDIERRLVELLKEYDKSLPGSFHEGAEITQLSISTGNFCHFKQINELCQEFLAMVEREEHLFFKALDEELQEEEIHEYNLIASTIGLKDALMPSRDNLYYSTLRKRREVYKSEGRSDFFEYVSLSKFRFFHPYRCAEFVEDRELVQRFATIYPRMKQEMREFARDAAKFKCCFRWSDDESTKPTDEDIEAFVDGKSSKEDIMKASGWVEVYVPKTEDELAGDMKYADMLHVASGPESLGGIQNSKYPDRIAFDPNRLTARFAADRRR